MQQKRGPLEFQYSDVPLFFSLVLSLNRWDSVLPITMLLRRKRDYYDLV